MYFKKYLSRLLFVMAGVITSQSSFSQKNYFSGHLVTISGDTINGLIDYRNWDKNPDMIKFKEQREGEVLQYTVNDINEFMVCDEVYIRGTVQKEISSVKTAELQYDSALKLEYDTVFLKLIIKGPRSLYHYMDENGRENFYIKRDSSFTLLLYKRYMMDKQGRAAIVEDKKYLGQLALYFQDCPSLNSKLLNTKYDHNSLRKLFLAYYDCTESEIEFQEQIRKWSTEFGVLAGGSMTKLDFSSENETNPIVNSEFSKSKNFTGGLFFEIFLPRQMNKWSICNELIYSTYNVSNGSQNYYENGYYNRYTEFGYTYIKINNLVRYKYPVGSFSVYFNGGISNGYAIEETNYYKPVSTQPSTGKSSATIALDRTRKYEQGYILGLGTKYGRCSVEMRYEKGNGMSDYLNLKSIAERYYILFGFRI